MNVSPLSSGFHFNPEDGGDIFLRNFGNHLQKTTVDTLMAVRSSDTYVFGLFILSVVSFTAIPLHNELSEATLQFLPDK
jgi:hypothetical protein